MLRRRCAEVPSDLSNTIAQKWSGSKRYDWIQLQPTSDSQFGFLVKWWGTSDVCCMHVQVQQNYLITYMEDQTAHLLAAIRQHMSEDPSYKVNYRLRRKVLPKQLGLQDCITWLALHFKCHTCLQIRVLCMQIMAFFVTARVTQFYCELFQAMGIPVLEMHSRKSQSQRTKAADQFRNSKGACIMFSSDVSARGVDYPDVTLVVQVSNFMFSL